SAAPALGANTRQSVPDKMGPGRSLDTVTRAESAPATPHHPVSTPYIQIEYTAWIRGGRLVDRVRCCDCGSYNCGVLASCAAAGTYDLGALAGTFLVKGAHP